MILLNQYAEYLRGILVVSEEDFRAWQDFLEKKYGISPPVDVE